MDYACIYDTWFGQYEYLFFSFLSFTACEWVAKKVTSCFRDDDDDGDFGSKSKSGSKGCGQPSQKEEKGPYMKVQSGDDCSG